MVVNLLLLLCSRFSKHREREFIFMALLAELRALWFTCINHLSVSSLSLMLRPPSRFCSFRGEEGVLQIALIPVPALGQDPSQPRESQRALRAESDSISVETASVGGSELLGPVSPLSHQVIGCFPSFMIFVRRALVDFY